MSIRPSQPPVRLRALPKQPDLNQLKTLAKELQRSYVAGEAETIAEVAQVFRPPAEEGLTLAHAQLALARLYGFQSWPKLKAQVDGMTREQLVAQVQAGDTLEVGRMLNRRPEMVDACTGQGEQRLLHLAVLNQDAAMLRLLMERGADARIGIFPHRESTTPLRMAKERGLTELVEVMTEVEAERQESLSCPNVTVSSELENLLELIRGGRNEDAMARLQASPTLLKQCDRSGMTALHVAAASANETMVNWLCDHYADPRKPDAKGYLPIDHAALSLGWYEKEKMHPTRRIMDRLLQRGSETTVWAAAATGDVDRLREIQATTPAQLESKWDHPGNRGGVLTRAAQFGQLEAVRCLLDFGLHPDEPIALGKASDDEDAISWGSPLHQAIVYGHEAIVRLLLDRGADPNANVYASGWPLDRAYENGHRHLVTLLYERGAKPAVYTICAAHDVEAAKRLLDEEGEDSKLVREFIWSAGCATCLPIFRLALPRFVELKAQLSPAEMDWHDLLCQPMRMGVPPEVLRPAAFQDDDRFEIMALLLQAGGDPNALGRFGLSLLHFVAARGGEGHKHLPTMTTAQRNRFAAQLLDAGADPAQRDELLCSSALGWACRYGRTELVRLYLERGISPQEPETPAWATPLQWAEKMEQAEILSLLAEAATP